MSLDLLALARDFLVIAYMLVLRIGVPILLVLMVGLWLERWLEEREVEAPLHPIPHSIPVARHCWEMKRNRDTEQAKAVSAQRPDLPCWLALQVNGRGVKEMCYTCPIFTAHAPAPIAL